MSQRNWGQVIVAGVGQAAVIASLLFVALEVRQNTAATKSATQQGIFDTGTQLQINVMNNERLRELIVAAEADPEWLDSISGTADYLLLSRFQESRFNFMENAFFHQSQGTLDPELWAGYDAWIRTAAVGNPVDQRFWKELRGAYSPRFREYMDATMADR